MPTDSAFRICPRPLLSGLLLAALAIQSVPVDAQRSAEQERFIAAEQALSRGDRVGFQSLREQLLDYPLLPYLDHDDLRRRLPGAEAAAIRAFLARHDGAPFAERLRRAYAAQLAAQRDWQGLVQHFREGDDETLRCQHANALWQLGRVAEAAHHTAALWRHGHSRPTQCDPAFDAWRAAGGLTDEQVWERLDLALRAGQPALARYLVGLVPASARNQAARWVALRDDPRDVVELQAAAATAAYDPVQAMVRYGFERFVSSDREAAMHSWARLRPTRLYDAATRAAVERRIGLSLATDHDPRAVRWLADIDDALADEDVRAWRVTTALRAGDMAAAAAALERLGDDEKDEPRWLYWRARVTQASGDAARGEALYRLAATDRGYYGFLAADRIGRPYNLNHETLQPAPEALQAMAATPAVRRVQELLQLDREVDARREWFALLQGLDAERLAEAAYLAHQWQWHGMAILTIARAGRFDALELRFPLPYADIIAREASRVGIEPRWVRSVMRQESAYMAGARSPAGALGLMQVMPATGRLLARQMGLRQHRTANLLDPETSVRFGSHYLADMREQMGGHLALATASYNAGPHRVRRWLPEHGAIDGDIWVDTIPFRETRGYVQLVLAYQTIHALREGALPDRVSAHLPAVRAGAAGASRAG